MSGAYYNEIDPFAAEWLRNLIRAGLIAPGDVDVRSIRDVHPLDLIGYTQCHFFAGIGVWSYALRLAGWPDDRAVWTGSCPCQPFSAAGKGEGAADARHLWPEWFRLIKVARPVAIFGEQVSAAIRHGWLDLVSTDLEGLDYAIGAAVMGAHSVGAPHIRQRLYFVAHHDQAGRRIERGARIPGNGDTSQRHDAHGCGTVGELADAEHAKRRSQHGPVKDERDRQDAGRQEAHGQSGTRSQICELADAEGAEQQRDNPEKRWLVGYSKFGDVGDTDHTGSQGRGERAGSGGSELPAGAAGPVNGFWRGATWLPCIDGKARPVEPGTFPLAHGAAARVGRLRAYGNAINAETAVAFISAFLLP